VITLERLVAERRFDWRRDTHRRALLENEISDELFAELAHRAGGDEKPVRDLIASYRVNESLGVRGEASWLARKFELLVAVDPEERAQREAANARLRTQARRAR
jgi:hypothetical protein